MCVCLYMFVCMYMSELLCGGQLLCGRDPHSSFHACATSTLLTEPFLQPFLKMYVHEILNDCIFLAN